MQTCPKVAGRPVGQSVRRACAVAFSAVLLVVNLRPYANPERGLDGTLRFIDHATDRGAAERMQDIYPEGFVFYHALTALAFCQAGPSLRKAAVVNRALAALDTGPAKAPQSADLDPPHGIFYRGWCAWVMANALATGQPDLATPARIARFESECATIAAAFERSDTPYLPSYPGLAWPCDSVVAMAALHRHDQLLEPRYGPLIRTWLAKATAQLDPETGLFAHSVHPEGTPFEGARGSSQSLLLPYLMTIEPDLGRAHYQRFREQFSSRLGGLVTIREYPRGQSSGGDVDSGPVIFGSSPVATVVTVAAARQAGDLAMADALCRTQETLLFPVGLMGVKRYGGGLMPAMDAFVAWTRTMPVGEGDWPSVRGNPWPLHLLSLLLAVTLWTSQSRSFRRALTPAARSG